MHEPRVLDELETRLRSGYAVDGQSLRVDEFEPEDDPGREYMRVKFRLGGKRFPGFFFTFDAQSSVEANLVNLSDFVRSHAPSAATAPTATKQISG